MVVDSYKECPWCSEQILETARKCKHCGEFLTDDRPTDGPGILCPHCQTRGMVSTWDATGTAKRGIHGGKATAGILTGGLSLLGTGLSRKESVAFTEYHCMNCKNTWRV